MEDIFGAFAGWFIHFLGITHGSSLSKAAHFFIEDGLKIFLMLYFIIFIISMLRKQVAPEKLREYVSGSNRAMAYFFAVCLGVFIPFCSCSAVPLFLGFVGAGIPLGICMAFLLSTALVSEIGAVLLLGLVGPEITALYVGVGMVIAYVGGYLADELDFKKSLRPGAVLFDENHYCNGHEHNHEHCACGHDVREQMSTLSYAHHFSVQTIKETWAYILVGVLLGAIIQGYVPDDFLVRLTRAANPWSVPLASVVGAFLYAPHGAVIPIFDSLLQKGVPLGTAMVVLMSTVVISFPEFAMIKKILSFKIIGLMLVYLLISFNIVGYLLNALY